jgi:hypothetical protein
MPVDLVSWDEERAPFGMGHVILQWRSTTPEDPDPYIVLQTREDATLTARALQRALVSVDIEIEAFDPRTQDQSGDLPGNPSTMAEALKGALKLPSVKAVLAGKRGVNPCVLVSTSTTYGRNLKRDGHTIPIATFEAVFRAFTVNVSDPTPIGTIQSVTATGETTASPETIETITEVVPE